MAAKEPTTGTSATPMMPAELFEFGQKRAEALMEFQKELFATLEQSNKVWLERMKLEADLLSKFTSKLSAVKSMPEAAGVCQEWMGQRMDLLKDDAQKIMDESQKLAKTSSRILGNGGGSASS
jgi:hypothetical protein